MPEDLGLRFDVTHLEREHEFVDESVETAIDEGRTDVERDVAQYTGPNRFGRKQFQNRLGIRVRRPGIRIDHATVDGFCVRRIGDTGLREHMQIGLPVQGRIEISVPPSMTRRVVELDRLPHRCRHASHQFRGSRTVDGGAIGIVNPVEPGGVLLEPEQRAREVEQDGLDRGCARRRHGRDSTSASTSTRGPVKNGVSSRT